MLSCPKMKSGGDKKKKKKSNWKAKRFETAFKKSRETLFSRKATLVRRDLSKT